jgi:hypothetical protein
MTNYTCQKPILAFSIEDKDYILHKGDAVDLDETKQIVKTYVAKGFIKATAATTETTSK